MQRNILWSGIDRHSLENCSVNSIAAGVSVNATILGVHNQIIFKVDYEVVTDQMWQTTFFNINSQLNDKKWMISLRSDGKGNWFENEHPIEKFTGCIDIDISLSPFTNSLPVNRLHFKKNTTEKIRVLYIDVLQQQTKAVEQVYTRLSATKYKYENVPNDFESVITVDEAGLVQEYPQLFTRIFTRQYNTHRSFQ